MSQQDFWKGEFGNEYIDRNKSEELLASNTILFAKILSQTQIRPTSVLEMGANIGLNLIALKGLLPRTNFAGVEINKLAAEILGKTGAKVFYGSIEEVDIQEKYDLVLTKGVLIHINPDNLEAVYQKMYSTSARWILTIEYYSRKADEVLYRGHQRVLFKRDFAGELMDKFGSNLRLIDYGFVYHKDTFPQDDLTWFLLEKTLP